MKYWLILPILLTGCGAQMGLTSLSLIDQNGFHETITNGDRLATFEKVNFEEPQPYVKALRVYDRDREGGALSIVTSYHENGQLYQRLEVVNGRAKGPYREWHSNGVQRLESLVIAGSADVDEGSMRTYVFDGTSMVWNEEGNLIAVIPYEKGKLEGESIYYHPNGEVQSQIPYRRGQREGLALQFDDSGALMSRVEYSQDQVDGEACGYWAPDQLAYQESYQNGLLFSGHYFDPMGNRTSEVNGGFGMQSMPMDEGGQQVVEHRDGLPEGLVKQLDVDGELVRLYHVRGGMKEGEEIEFYPRSRFRRLSEGERQPKLSVEWRRGEVHGRVQTWFQNGRLESQREMQANRKNGTSMAWYSDGSLMLVEEYREDRLVRGEYYERGASQPISRVAQGKGVASLYDCHGKPMKRVNYVDGSPLLS